jgi:predicted dehydrogenase
VLDFVHSVLGEYESFRAHTQIQRPQRQVVGSNTNGPKEDAKSNVPDLISIHGSLQSSLFNSNNASLDIHFQVGPPFPGTTAFTWTINGEKGAIQLSSQLGPLLQYEEEDEIPIKLHDFETDQVEKVKWGWTVWQKGIASRGRNVAMTYDLFFKGREKEAGIADFESAVRRHGWLDGVLWGR